MRLKQYINEGRKESTRETRLQECLACVGFSIYQIKGKITQELLLDEELFRIAYDTYCDVDTSVDELWTFCENQAELKNSKNWVYSVVKTVNAAMKDTKASHLTKSNYKFSRTVGFMRTVYTQFKKFKKEYGFAQDDKWNPGDIWASTINSVSGDFDTLIAYNKYISDNLKDGKFVGISLKKIENKSVFVEHITPAGDDFSEFEYLGMPKPTTPFTTGITLISNNNLTINIRSFNKRDRIRAELIFKGQSSRGGKISQYLMRKTITDYTIPQETFQNIKGKMEKDDKNHILPTDPQLKLRDEVMKLWLDASGYTWSDNKLDELWKSKINRSTDVYKKSDDHRITYWESRINTLLMLKFFNEKSESANKIINDWYVSGASRSEFSSEHIKIHDGSD